MKPGNLMRKIFKNFIIGAFLIGIITSCNDNEVQGPLDPEAARQELENMGSEMSTDIAAMVESEGYKPVEDLMQKLEQDTSTSIFARKSSSVPSLREFSGTQAKAIVNPFIPQFLRTSTDGTTHERFDFEAKKGIYAWNPETNKFDSVGASDQKVVVKFPTKESDTNNAVFTISDYQDIQVKDQYSSQYLPTAINANLTVNDTEKIRLSYQVTWKENGLGASQASIELFLDPFTFKLIGNDAEAKASSIDFTILDKNENTLINFYFKGIFETETKEQIATLETNLQYRAFKINGDVDVAGIQSKISGSDGSSLSDVSQLNEYINLTVNKNERKIGDIVIDMNETTGQPDAFVQFTDDSKKSLQEVLKPVITKIKALTQDDNTTS